VVFFNAVLASLDFSIEDIALNLFYLHARMHNVYEIENPHSLSKPDVRPRPT
jgi:hypothetical protein